MSSTRLREVRCRFVEIIGRKDLDLIGGFKTRQLCPKGTFILLPTRQETGVSEFLVDRRLSDPMMDDIVDRNVSDPVTTQVGYVPDLSTDVPESKVPWVQR